ncbi:hypothetical protein [Candidatus Regnicoccus frigidus]|uniref:hypothetical protein n=1 Tax=Candidatus Regnicoccus frigidus TaxID=3074015 RepID=UPI0028BD5DC1|nr:hypothetical protein [Candidatus Regnicoccus frigidus]
MLLTFELGGPTPAEQNARILNELLTEHRVSKAISDFEEAQPEEEAPAPIFTEEPIDPNLQTGDSRLLGGAMEIKAPHQRS